MRGGDTLYICVAASYFVFMEVIKMNAKKCDRCGSFYEGDGGYKKAGDLRLIRSGVFNDDCVDLCPHCQLSLRGWLKYNVEFIEDKEDTRNEPKRIP